MKITSAEFQVSAPDLSSCPPSSFAEFAFIGRSNVGKSSLINMLVERRELAKVSDTPGKTRLINFFIVNKAWTLVDLPGYGYAQGSKVERASFNEAVADFIEHRPNLARLFVLIDSRLPPQKIDLHFLNWLATTATPFALVFTKIDKQSASRTRASIAQFTKTLSELNLPVPEILACSSTTRVGRVELLASIERTLAEPRPARP